MFFIGISSKWIVSISEWGLNWEVCNKYASTWEVQTQAFQTRYRPIWFTRKGLTTCMSQELGFVRDKQGSWWITNPNSLQLKLIVNHYTLLSICLLWNPPRWVMTHDPWWTSVFHMLLNAQVAWTSRLAGGWISCGRSHWGSSGRYAGWRESNGAWRGRSGSGLKNWHGVRRVSSRFSAPGIIKVVNHCCSQQFEMNEPTFLAP